MDNIYIDIRYECDFIKELFENKDMITIEEILNKLEDLYDEKTNVEIKFEEFKQEVEDNYRPLKYEEQI